MAASAIASLVLGRAQIGQSGPVDDAYPLPEPEGTCPVCGHPEVEHVYWSPDSVCDGWSHCTVGSEADACPCWRSWPKVGEGCPYCRDFQNRNFGHLDYVAVESDTGVHLLRCPRCNTLYQDDSSNDPLAVPISEAEERWGYRSG